MLDNGWPQSAEAWIASVDAIDPNRDFLLDEVMLRMAGNVVGKRVLDVGCGEGRFCRMLRRGEAEPIGIDPTIALVEEADRRGSAGFYVAAGGEALPFLCETFDLVVSYVTLLDIADYRAAVREMARVLRPGGAIVISNCTSFRTACIPPWVSDPEGRRLYKPFDKYAEERADWVEWKGIRIQNWHRPESSYMQAFLAQGLRLGAYEEPLPSAKTVARFPAMAEHFRAPNFVVMRWIKD